MTRKGGSNTVLRENDKLKEKLETAVEDTRETLASHQCRSILRGQNRQGA